MSKSSVKSYLCNCLKWTLEMKVFLLSYNFECLLYVLIYTLDIAVARIPNLHSIRHKVTKYVKGMKVHTPLQLNR